jgi:hypothetical protein
MDVRPTPMTVNDYCAAYERGDVIVNRDYQRSDRVWPEMARSYLIETIILGFPLPKFTLYTVTDIASRKTIKEIVDGQQRTHAILRFYHDRMKLSGSLDTVGLQNRLFSELEPEHQASFLNAALSVDQIFTSTRDEIRQAFRRMNSYTIPLNPEEHRHAQFQGRMKWLLQRVSDEYDEALYQMGVFSEKQLVRMADTKLLAELCDALLHGIRTTNRTVLDRLHKERDENFPEEDDLKRRLRDAFDTVRRWEPVFHTNIMKVYNVYALLLAVTHIGDPIGVFSEYFHVDRVVGVDDEAVMRNLLVLHEVLETELVDERFADFVRACESKTNVGTQRIIRFRYMCEALTREAL